jgi:hypothetical protein
MLRKSMIALAALVSVGTVTLSPITASAFGGGHGFGGHSGGFGGHGFGGHYGWSGGYRGYHWGYGNSYCWYWPCGYYQSSYSPSYSAPAYAAPAYSAPTPAIAVNQKVYVEGNNNGGPPLAAPDGPPPPR